MSNIKVSVCVLSYNHEQYLRDCLEGIVMQKTTFPIEAWVHDDASTDSSQEIIKEYQQRYPDIIKPILQTENQYSKKQGSILQNFLYPHCAGEYIALCEGDDYWIDPYKLQKQVDFLDAHRDYVACVHNAIVTSGGSSSLFALVSPQSTDWQLEQILSRWSIPTASLIFRSKNQSRFEKMYPNGDYALEIWLLAKGKIRYSPLPMSVYRRHADSMSVSMNNCPLKMYDDIIALFADAKLWYSVDVGFLFDNAIAKYTQMKETAKKEMFFENHPLLKALRPKTYKRIIKNWLQKIVNK